MQQMFHMNAAMNPSVFWLWGTHSSTACSGSWAGKGIGQGSSGGRAPHQVEGHPHQVCHEMLQQEGRALPSMQLEPMFGWVRWYL